MARPGDFFAASQRSEGSHDTANQILRLAQDDGESRKRAATTQITPASTTATGTTRMPCASVLRSDRYPISGCDGMSPTRCMTNTASPIAVARSIGLTSLTIAELTGPVLMKMSTSATMMAGL